MGNDRDILIDALEIALRTYEKKHPTRTLLGPTPDSDVLDPIAAAIEKCEVYDAVAGHMLFSAYSGMVLHAPNLAAPLFYRVFYGADQDVSEAADWLIRVLGTRTSEGRFCATIWGLSVDKEVALSATARLMPFAGLPDSSMKKRILERARKPWDESVWMSQSFFDAPQVAYVETVVDFPYIRTDNASFKRIGKLEEEARKRWTLIESTCVGRPLAFGSWFEYADADLDLSAWENSIMWSLPEIAPHIKAVSRVDASVLKGELDQFLRLPAPLQETLLRSMGRFTLSQCRYAPIDRILDLALAFEMAVSGKGDNAPPSWKVSVRSAQLMGGSLANRQEYRKKIADLYALRNKATHGSTLSGAAIEKTIEVATELYPILLRSFLRLAREPDWPAIELEPAFGSK